MQFKAFESFVRKLTFLAMLASFCQLTVQAAQTQNQSTTNLSLELDEINNKNQASKSKKKSKIVGATLGTAAVLSLTSIAAALGLYINKKNKSNTKTKKESAEEQGTELKTFPPATSQDQTNDSALPLQILNQITTAEDLNIFNDNLYLDQCQLPKDKQDHHNYFDECGINLEEITKQFVKLSERQRRDGGLDPNIELYAKILSIKANTKILFVGDIHGKLDALVEIINDWIAKRYISNEFKVPDNTIIVCLGDYTDRGPASKAVLSTLFSFKCLNPDNVFLVRGNHERMGDQSFVYNETPQENRPLSITRCFKNLKNIPDANEFAKQVSKAFVPELFISTEDGHRITASHSMPPHWNDSFSRAGDAFVDHSNGFDTTYVVHCKEKDNKGNMQEWDEFFYWNAFAEEKMSGLRDMSEYFGWKNAPFNAVDHIRSALEQGNVEISFYGHEHPKSGHHLFNFDNVLDINYAQDHNPHDVGNDITPGPNKRLICVLNTNSKTIIKSSYAMLDVGNSRANWKLEFFDKALPIPTTPPYNSTSAAASTAETPPITTTTYASTTTPPTPPTTPPPTTTPTSASTVALIAAATAATTTIPNSNQNLNQPNQAQIINTLNFITDNKNKDKFADDKIDVHLTNRFAIANLFVKNNKHECVDSEIYAQVVGMTSEIQRILVIGDLHGNQERLNDMLDDWTKKAFTTDRYFTQPDTYVIFLGDYVDRGPASKAVLTTLFGLKILNPNNVFLMRGNHDVHKCTDIQIPGLVKFIQDQALAIQVSKTLLPELVLMAPDGHAITAAHSVPVVWDDRFYTKSYLADPILEDLKNFGESSGSREWTPFTNGKMIEFTNVYPKKFQSLKFFPDGKNGVSFFGHDHYKNGYNLYLQENVDSSVFNCWNPYANHENQPDFNASNKDKHFLCQLNNHDLDGIPFCYAELTLGNSRKDWELKFHDGKS